MSLAMDSDNMIKSLQDELASAKMALAQAREELEVEKRFSASEKQYAATCAQKYLLLRERSQLTKDTLVKAQNDFKSEKRKNEELEQVISDLQREMASPKMVPEVLDALIKIAGMSVRVKDVLDREGYMVT
jgi:chromosome segregation ATPase